MNSDEEVSVREYKFETVALDQNLNQDEEQQDEQQEIAQVQPEIPDPLVANDVQNGGDLFYPAAARSPVIIQQDADSKNIPNPLLDNANNSQAKLFILALTAVVGVFALLVATILTLSPRNRISIGTQTTNSEFIDSNDNFVVQQVNNEVDIINESTVMQLKSPQLQEAIKNAQLRIQSPEFKSQIQEMLIVIDNGTPPSFDAFPRIDPTGTRFASGPARLSTYSFPFYLLDILCVLAYFSREGNAVAKGGRGQLALLQV
ncbi:MAG: hypothetical protein EZS28_039869, partial [Streblomastix strix]